MYVYTIVHMWVCVTRPKLICNEISENEMRQIHMAMPVLEIKQKLNKYLQAIQLQLTMGGPPLLKSTPFGANGGETPHRPTTHS